MLPFEFEEALMNGIFEEPESAFAHKIYEDQREKSGLKRMEEEVQ
jgi:hypothetical protein